MEGKLRERIRTYTNIPPPPHHHHHPDKCIDPFFPAEFEMGEGEREKGRGKEGSSKDWGKEIKGREYLSLGTGWRSARLTCNQWPHTVVAKWTSGMEKETILFLVTCKVGVYDDVRLLCSSAGL